MQANMPEWRTRNFSFQTACQKSYILPTDESWGVRVEPIPVEDDPPDEGQAPAPVLVIELETPRTSWMVVCSRTAKAASAPG